MLVKNEIILAKLEGVGSYNTDSVPAGADAILVENLSWGFDSPRMIDRPSIRGSLGSLQAIFGGTLKMVSFDVEIKGSGTAGTAPELGPLLVGAGFAETIVASTSVTYKHASDSATHDSLSIYYHQDGLRHKITGCRCFSMSFTAGVESYGKLTMSFVGHDAGTSDTANPTPVYSAQVPPKFLNVGLTVGSYAAVISALAFDMGFTAARQPDVNATDGFGEVLISGRAVTGSIDPSAVTIATNDFLGDFLAGNLMDIGTGLIGSAGNQWQLILADSYYDNISIADREGVRTFDTPFRCTDELTTDDEVTLAFT